MFARLNVRHSRWQNPLAKLANASLLMSGVIISNWQLQQQTEEGGLALRGTHAVGSTR